MIRQYTFSQLTTAGNAGAAAGTVTSEHPIVGELLAVHLNFGGTTATTDTTLATVHAPTKTLLSISNSVTDAWYYPREQMHNTSGSALTLDGTQPRVGMIPVCDHLRVTVAQANADETLDVTVLYKE